MSERGQKIIDGIKDAIAGNFAAVTIDGQRWIPSPAWQPMGTAPRDGTNILVCSWRTLDKTLYPMIAVASWDVEGIGGDGGWVLDDDYALTIDHPVTHWMPLPEPPVSP